MLLIFRKVTRVAISVARDSGYEPVQVDLRGQIMQADLMERGGDPHQRTSAFQARRTRQIELLQTAWRDLFHSELTRASAKDMLVYCDDYAEDVLDTMEAVKARGNIQSPITYTLRTLQRKRDERASKPEASVRVAAGDTDEHGDDYYLKEPTPCTRKIQQRWEQLVAEGKVKSLAELGREEEDY